MMVGFVQKFFFLEFFMWVCDCDYDGIFVMGFVGVLIVVIWCCYIWLSHGFVVYGE